MFARLCVRQDEGRGIRFIISREKNDGFRRFLLARRDSRCDALRVHFHVPHNMCTNLHKVVANTVSVASRVSQHVYWRSQVPPEFNAHGTRGFMSAVVGMMCWQTCKAVTLASAASALFCSDAMKRRPVRTIHIHVPRALYSNISSGYQKSRAQSFTLSTQPKGMFCCAHAHVTYKVRAHVAIRAKPLLSDAVAQCSHHLQWIIASLPLHTVAAIRHCYSVSGIENELMHVHECTR
jgi:hypothetical protein